jgi:RHS repeat-associated protein
MRRSFAKICLFLIIFIFQFLSFNEIYAEELGSGWYMRTAEPVSPEEAEAYYNSRQPETLLQSAVTSQTVQALASSATTATDEIRELARALQYDPKLIYNYVHNNIDYVPYFGSIKGATLTYFDGSGNDFDQASLFIALLRESAIYNTSIGTVQYVYGTMDLPYNQIIANWLGVDSNKQVIDKLIKAGGIPSTPHSTYFHMTRVWIKANIDEVDYLFDPAGKQSQYINKIDIGQTISYDQNEFLTAVQSGATVATDYVKNLNEANIGNYLATYTSTLVNAINSQYPNKDLKEIIGGRSIIQTNLTQYTTTLPNSPAVISYWDDIPDNRTATVRIQLAGIDCKLYTPDFAVKRLTIRYFAGDHHPELRLDGSIVPVTTECPSPSGNATTLGSKNNLTISIDHPYPASYDQTSPDYTAESGRTYAIISNFGGASDSLLQKRQKQLDAYLAQGLSNTSEAVLGETLNIMGHTWMKERRMVSNLLSSIAETNFISHHHIGVMAQEAGYYIDAKTSVSSIISRHDIRADEDSHFKVFTLIGSALEHGILEQLMGSDNPGISTVKILHLANKRGQKIFWVDLNNHLSIAPQLVHLDKCPVGDMDHDLNANYALILPQDCDTGMGSWSGSAYISKYFDANSGDVKMIISGGYHGGYASNTGDVQAPIVNNTVSNQVYSSYTPVNTYRNTTPMIQNLSKEPVDMASGAYLYEDTDMSLGVNHPMGLAFSRSYNSNLNLSKRTLGYGWTHNYDIYLDSHSHGDPGLGSRQPVDAAALISALYVSFDLMTHQDNFLGWVTASLISNWAVDQLIDNAVTAHLGNKLMEFIKLPDGSYSPPPGVTTQLIKNADSTYSLKERFGTQIDFNTSNKITKSTDVDGNVMTFTYTGNNLTTMKDAFNRTLTLTYSNNKLTSVSDSAGRSVSYGYTGDDLTTYHDTENKTWAYGYADTNNPHRMTSLINPLNITTATNAYDSLGRVMTQTVPRQSGTSAIYNFYFSGFRNAEEDPDGKKIIYYYDEKGRPVATENQLGNKTSMEYDGQFHVIKTKDSWSTNETIYEYDGNQNLTKITNALNKEVNNIYDSQFHLTDTIDPLNHGAHSDYDAEHHPISSKYGIQYDANFSPIDNGISQTSAAYYANGLPQTATDARGTVTTLTYDAYGNLETAKTGAHPAIKTTYNPTGWLSSLTDQVDTTTNFNTYNKRGQLMLKTDPLGKTTSFTYYDDGNFWTKIDRNGNTTTYTYTPTGKLDTITYQDTTSVHFTYNQHDDLTGMQDSVGNTAYIYDAAHRLTSSTFTYTLNPYSFTVSYSQYDANGNLTELTYPGNKKVIYTYDELNRLKTVKIDWLSPKPVATYYYDDAGRLDYLVNFNGTITDYSYDNANRLTALDNKKSDNTTILASYSFTLDANGNRTNVVQNEPLAASPVTQDIPYYYNATSNRLLEADENLYLYDFEGQLSSSYDSGSRFYTFDYEHRLKSITGTVNYQYFYDGAGNRVQATRNSTVTRYIYDAGGNLLAEADGSNNITKYYIHGLGLMAMVTPTNQVYTYHFNAVGSTIAMTDSSQAMVNKYAYDAFGNIVNQQETVSQSFKFVGQFGVMTEPNGFYYMRARYYDPQVGRFISEDPIGFGGGDENLMAYVGSNPVNLIDPSGLMRLEFDDDSNTLYVYPGTAETQGPPQAFQANNNVVKGKDPWPSGTYSFSYYKSHPESGVNGSYGSNGNFVFNVPGRSGMGVHSGQANQGGPDHVTNGCIRTTDAATQEIYNKHFGGDPLTQITVRRSSLGSSYGGK